LVIDTGFHPQSGSIQPQIVPNKLLPESLKATTLQQGKLMGVKWADVQVGDVLRIENNQFVEADVLLLTTNEVNGRCFIDTADLDG